MGKGMMDSLLDCSTTTSAVQSVAKLLGIDRDKLRIVLREIGPIPQGEAPEYYIPQKVFSVLSRPVFPVSSLWFHATRVVEPNSFSREGILPKSKMNMRLRSLLGELSCGMKSGGDYPNSSSVIAKLSINDEGPFAFLFRSVAVEAPGSHHSYLEIPELVEDIAGSLLGANYVELVEKYKAKTVPCLLTFRAKAEEWAFNRVLWFAYQVDSGCNDLEASDIANTCYSGDGVGIPPADIVKVEVID